VSLPDSTVKCPAPLNLSNNQVKNWFFWFLFVFVVITLLVECVSDCDSTTS